MAPAAPTARRADAQRNVDAIIQAATECLGSRPDATVAEIAEAAGVGRVTLYGHFSSRAELVEAVMVHVLELGNAVLDPVDLSGDPRAALERLVEASWEMLNQSRFLLVAAQKELSPSRIRDLHADHSDRAAGLLERGRAEGVFRTDLSVPWLVATLQNVMHGAADEITAGRLATEDAARYISATVIAAFTPPGQPVPEEAAGRSGTSRRSASSS
jgi:TetR/AcrR family transcriptional regulator, mexCD-oprJ operon repressor